MTNSTTVPRLLDINRCYLADERELVDRLIAQATVAADAGEDVTALATRLIERVRARPDRLSALDRFLVEYDLGHTYGVVLMCLAEALLRIPDATTADAFIIDKISGPDWARHLGGDDLLVNASTWGLMIGGKLLPPIEAQPRELLRNLLRRLGEPVIRSAVRHAMRIIADQFVMGVTIDKALVRCRREARDYETFSYDMLGEAALTADDAERYCAAYAGAIEAVANAPHDGWADRAGISVKLSALCPRFDVTQHERAVAELGGRLGDLARASAAAGLQLTVDAEESDRLEMSLEVIDTIVADAAFADWDGFGIAVQAYQKRAIDVIDHLHERARTHGRRLRVRLVKGAYWDTEIKLAQARGLEDFPVFTRKCNTDVSYLACAARIVAAGDLLLGQFATHNARTVAWIMQCAGGRRIEFQRLHGMGEALYEALAEAMPDTFQCRVYAPVGGHEVLLPYLVRRLLENGANSSFVHRIADDDVPVHRLVEDPLIIAAAVATRRHPQIARPFDVFPGRRASAGFNFADTARRGRLLAGIAAKRPHGGVARPIVDGRDRAGNARAIHNPAAPGVAIGTVEFADTAIVADALEVAADGWRAWEARPAAARATLLEACAHALEGAAQDLVASIVCETGRTLVDAHAEIREAVDFLRYYAGECRRLFARPAPLPGITGEASRLALRGRGVCVTISPWNFPVSIFVGQIAAALAAGNTVIAKPAEQSSLTAAATCRLLYAAGIPASALQFVPGEGETIGTALVSDPRVAVVAFTGSTAVAGDIARRLAARAAPPPALIAETGGINCMIADSSALPEQVVVDVANSAFNSAGQRCSALRVLYVQQEIADDVLRLLCGHARELVIGDPMSFATDIGPVIDAVAYARLNEYVAAARERGKLAWSASAPAGPGYFVPPAIVRIDHIAELPGEVFGPVLHVREFAPDALESVCDEIDSTGFGLTLGIHSRINRRIDVVTQRVQAGNVYVNRNMIGAVVESQPFGGTRASGTGPKAGGPNYLGGFAREQTVTENTAAVGGNAALITLTDDAG